MLLQPTRTNRHNRPAAASVELAVLVPFLTFIFLITVDFGRVFYYSITLNNAAAAGALYGCLDSMHAKDTSGIKTAALADATNVSNPTVTSTQGTDSNGNPTVNVTVAYTLSSLTNYPGIPPSVSLSRTVSMRVLP
jgi:Flp pilus assembly protein TadG